MPTALNQVVFVRMGFIAKLLHDFYNWCNVTVRANQVRKKRQQHRVFSCGLTVLRDFIPPKREHKMALTDIALNSVWRGAKTV